jgi:hypothetical protein
MRIFVDCEFNGFGGDLISMALVPEDESIAPWYEVIQPPEGNRCVFDRWVWDNVISVVGKRAIPRDDFRAEFLRYIQRFDNPTICADWYTDLVHFFSMFAGQNHTESVGFACRTELKLIEEYDSEIPHNALSDAIAIRKAWLSPTNTTLDEQERAIHDR